MPVPKKQVSKMIFDGRDTKGIMNWIRRTEGYLDGVDLGNPTLQAILDGLMKRIQTLQISISNLSSSGDGEGLSDLYNITGKNSEKIASLIQELQEAFDRLSTLEGTVVDEEGVAMLGERLTTMEQNITELTNLIGSDIEPIKNSKIDEMLG